MNSNRLILCLTLFMSSCASIINLPSDSIELNANETVRIVVNADSSFNRGKFHYIDNIERTKQPLIITAYSDSLSKTVKVKSRNSIAYWMNLCSPYAMGFLFDMGRPQRYNYPKNIYIDMKDTSSSYLTYVPNKKQEIKYSNILKFTVLKPLSPINSGVELSYEKRINQSFTAELSSTYLFGKNSINYTQVDPNIKGFRVGLEGRHYLKRSAPKGVYLGLAYQFLKNSYQSVESYENSDSTISESNSVGFYKPAIYSDTVKVNKMTHAINFKLGYQFVKNRFSADVYLGLGIKIKNISHSDKRSPNNNITTRSGLHDISYVTNRPGNYVDVSFPLNIKVGWLF